MDELGLHLQVIPNRFFFSSFEFSEYRAFNLADNDFHSYCVQHKDMLFLKNNTSFKLLVCISVKRSSRVASGFCLYFVAHLLIYVAKSAIHENLFLYAYIAPQSTSILVFMTSIGYFPS